MTRRMVAVLLLALVGPASVGAGDTEDFVYLGPRPVFIRLRVTVDGKPYRDPFVRWLREIFTACDADRNGHLSGEEAARLPQADRLRSNESSPRRRGERKPDENGDGIVEFEEFVRSVEDAVGPAMTVRLGDGLTAPGGNQARLKETSGHFLRLLDADHDSRLSLPEMTNAPAELARFDRDDDGTLSQAEASPSNPYARYVQPRQPGPFRSRDSIPFLRLSEDEVSAKAVRQFCYQYDRKSESGIPDLQLSPDELPLPEAVFRAHDGNQDRQLDFDEVLALLRQATPQIECTVYVADQWERTPAIEVDCQDPSLEATVRRSPSGEVTIGLGSAQIELSLPSSGLFDTAVFFTQQFQQADSDNNGYVEQSEARNNYYINQSFAAADADGDKKLFADELRALVEARQKSGQSRVVLDLADAGRNLYEILDANRDRRLSATELKSLPGRLSTWDVNQDLALEESEVPRHFRLTVRCGTPQIPGLNLAAPEVVPFGSPAVLSPPSGPQWFQKMDRNSDGEITRREFLGLPKLFDRLDTNRDGTLSPAEAALP